MGLKTTITFDDPSDFTYDPALLQVVGGIVKLLPISYPDEITYYPFNTPGDASPARGATVLTLKGAGAAPLPVIDNGVLSITYTGTTDESYAEMSGGFTGSTKYAYQLKWIPHFSTVVSTTALFHIHNTDGSTNGSLKSYLTNQGGGVTRIWIDVTADDGTILLHTLTTLTLIQDHSYDLAFSYDESTGELRFFVDGVLKISSTLALGHPLNLNSTTLFQLGHVDGISAVSAKCDFTDIQVWSDAVFSGNAGPLTYPTLEKFTYVSTENLIYLNSLINMSNPLGFSDISTISQGLSIIGYFFEVDGVKYWFNGVDWALSNGTIAQSNTAAEIEAAKDLFPTIDGGASVRINMLLQSLDGYTTPNIDQLNLDYSLYIIPSDVPSCIVYGVVKDNSGNPVGGAKVTFDTPDFFYNENLIATSVFTYSDSRGAFIVSLVETATNNVEATCTIEYKQDGKKVKNKYTGLIIPNTSQATLASLI